MQFWAAFVVWGAERESLNMTKLQNRSPFSCLSFWLVIMAQRWVELCNSRMSRMQHLAALSAIRLLPVWKMYLTQIFFLLFFFCLTAISPFLSSFLWFLHLFPAKLPFISCRETQPCRRNQWKEHKRQNVSYINDVTKENISIFLSLDTWNSDWLEGSESEWKMKNIWY